MKIIFLMTFSLVFALLSCQNDSNITINAKLPLYKATGNGKPNQGKEDGGENSEKDIERGFKLSKDLFKELNENNLTTNFNTLTFNKQKIKLKISNIKAEVKDNYMSFGFETWINASKSQLLVLYLGLEDKTNNKYLDTSLMFAGGDIFELLDKDNINIDIDLKPVITVSGKVWTEDNKGIKSVVNILPAKLKNEKDFVINLNKETQKDGNFNLKTIYGVFKNKILSNKFNIMLIAKNENGIGFTIVGKEENSNLETKNDVFKSLLACYLADSDSPIGNERVCKNITLKDTQMYQSGNLLPGIKLISDIKTYSKVDNGVVTGVSSPRFALDLRDRNILDLISGVYYGNFFISGFNLFKLFKNIYPDLGSNDDIKGKIRIYYDKEGGDDFYLEYKGEFIFYSIDIVKRISSLNPGVLQNKLPFYELYDLDGEEIYLDSVIDDGLDKDGNWKGRFLGIENLRELKGKPVRVDFYYTDRYEEEKCKVLYNIPNEIDINRLPSCDD